MICKKWIRGLSTAATSIRKEEPTKLTKILQDSIKTTGALSVSQYMRMCLSHPTAGYYMYRDVFGHKGDFITSPEISQVFHNRSNSRSLENWLPFGF